jgi:hypothetical protein
MICCKLTFYFDIKKYLVIFVPLLRKNIEKDLTNYQINIYESLVGCKNNTIFAEIILLRWQWEAWELQKLF